MRLKVAEPMIVLHDQGNHFTFDTRTGDLTRVNETAALLLSLADGTRSIDSILLEASRNASRNKVEKSRKWLEKAVDSGLLVGHEPDNPAPALQAADLHAIAARLMSQDEVRKAYLVQKRVVELPSAQPAHWYQMAELAHIAGLRDEARLAYEQYFAFHPADPEVAHILHALRNAPLPDRAPDDYIKHLYQRFSVTYEADMRQDLRYAAPEHLLAAIKQRLAGRKDLVAADLGCGTGLFGTKLQPLCCRLLGVDLSPEMLEIAASTQAYDRLECAEISIWLNHEPPEHYDLITFCDTLIYFGDLRPVLAGCFRHLKPGGLVAFTLEKSDTLPLVLGDSGRFRHHRNHVRDAAAQAGFEVVYRSEKTLRMEYGKPVVGLVTVLKMPETVAGKD